MNASGEAVAAASLDFEAVFLAHYERVARIVARVVRDRGRAEELAVEVFLKLWRTPPQQDDGTAAWLYRVAVRTALNELRRHARQIRYERLLGGGRALPTPEEIHSAAEEQERVRVILGAIAPRQAELLILRSDGLNYAGLAAALGLNPASIGTFLRRAQQAFRKEYITRYGEE